MVSRISGSPFNGLEAGCRITLLRVLMTKERLSSLSQVELRRVASRFRLKPVKYADRESLVYMLLDHFADLKTEREQSNNLQMRGEEKKYEISTDEELGVSLLAETIPIPSHYNETQIRAMVRDPEWAYAYWEIKATELRKLKKNPKYRGLFLRVHDVNDVRYDGTNSNSYFDIPLKMRDDHWYIHLPQPGRSYVLELIYINSRKPHILARSDVIHTPKGRLADSDICTESSLPDEILLALSSHDKSSPLSTSDSNPHRVSRE